MAHSEIEEELEEEVDVRDSYAHGSLVASKQPYTLYESIKVYFQMQAAFAGRDTYHFGNSTVTLREMPMDHDFLEHNISIDFIAEQESLLEKDIKKVRDVFSGLHVYRGESDALMALEFATTIKK